MFIFQSGTQTSGAFFRGACYCSTELQRLPSPVNRAPCWAALFFSVKAGHGGWCRKTGSIRQNYLNDCFLKMSQRAAAQGMCDSTVLAVIFMLSLPFVVMLMSHSQDSSVSPRSHMASGSMDMRRQDPGL